MFNKLKVKNGITLIALVITIVVLIILATIVVNLSLGDNGMFNRAREAKEQYNNSQEYEDKQIAETTNRIDSIANVRNMNEDSIRAIIREEINNSYETITIKKNDTETVANTKGETYTLDKSINDYKYLIVYGSLGDCYYSSVIVDKSKYRVGAIGELHHVGIFGNTGWMWNVYFCFPTENSIKIQNSERAGWPGTPQIYLIKGMKI